MLFLFLTLSLSSRNDIDSIKQDIDLYLENINDEVDMISAIKKEIRAIQSSNKISSNINYKVSEIQEEKPFMLVEMESFKEMNNLNAFKGLVQKNDLPSNLPISWMVKSSTPSFTFATPCPTLVNQIKFDPLPEFNALIKLLRFEFYHNDQLIFSTKIYDLPNGYTDQIIFNLETNVVFSKFRVTVIENWGDATQTYLNLFHLFGPKS